MAGLKKPDACPCGSTDLQRQFGPERWVCLICAKVVRTRQSKPDQNSCRDCGAARGSKPFKPGKNQCLECARKAHQEWTKQNIDHLKQYRSQPDFKAKRRVAVRKAYQRSPEAFLRYLMHHITKQSSYKIKPNGRPGRLRKGGSSGLLLPVEIDLPFLLGLWESQRGRCALSRLKMSHRFNDPLSASIDRKDSAKGYVPGNVQLVCQWVNRAKNNAPDLEFKRILNSLTDYGLHLNDVWQQEPETPVLAFLCLVRDVVYEELWEQFLIKIDGTDMSLEFTIGDELRLRLYNYDFGMEMDFWRHDSNSEEHLPPTWKGPVLVEMADPTTPERIVALLRDGLVHFNR